MAEQDYCQYIISKCVNKGCFLATNGMFRTTKAFWNLMRIVRVFDKCQSER